VGVLGEGGGSYKILLKSDDLIEERGGEQLGKTHVKLTIEKESMGCRE